MNKKIISAPQNSQAIKLKELQSIFEKAKTTKSFNKPAMDNIKEKANKIKISYELKKTDLNAELIKLGTELKMLQTDLGTLKSKYKGELKELESMSTDEKGEREVKFYGNLYGDLEKLDSEFGNKLKKLDDKLIKVEKKLFGKPKAELEKIEDKLEKLRENRYAQSRGRGNVKISTKSDSESVYGDFASDDVHDCDKATPDEINMREKRKVLLGNLEEAEKELIKPDNPNQEKNKELLEKRNEIMENMRATYRRYSAKREQFLDGKELNNPIYKHKRHLERHLKNQKVAEYRLNHFENRLKDTENHLRDIKNFLNDIKETIFIGIIQDILSEDKAENIDMVKAIHSSINEYRTISKSKDVSQEGKFKALQLIFDKANSIESFDKSAMSTIKNYACEIQKRCKAENLKTQIDKFITDIEKTIPAGTDQGLPSKGSSSDRTNGSSSDRTNGSLSDNNSLTQIEKLNQIEKLFEGTDFYMSTVTKKYNKLFNQANQKDKLEALELIFAKVNFMKNTSMLITVCKEVEKLDESPKQIQLIFDINSAINKLTQSASNSKKENGSSTKKTGFGKFTFSSSKK